MSEEFDPLDLDEKTSCPVWKKPQTIIKKSRFRNDEPVMVKSPNHSDNIGADYVQPIMRGLDVIGVIHTCSCGKTTEIMFDFDTPSEGTEFREL